MKEQLSKCVSMQDSHEVFSSCHTDDIDNFVTALKNAQQYIDLTMRDEFLLNQAGGILVNRGYGY